MILLGKIIEKYEIYMKQEKNISDSTLSSYVSDLKKYDSFLVENNISEPLMVNKTLILQYLMELQKNDVASSTIARNLSSLRSFFQYLLNKGEIKEDPTLNLKTPKIQRKSPDILTIEEIDTLLKQPDLNSKKGIRDRAMMELMYSTGIGVNEIIALDRDNYDSSFEIVLVKDKEDERALPLGKMALIAVNKYLDEYKNVFKSDALFVNRQGKRITRQGFWKNLKEYQRNSGIDKNITPQILRQSVAVHMLENGSDVETVQKMLGHSDVTTTQLYAYKAKESNIREVFKSTHPRA